MNPRLSLILLAAVVAGSFASCAKSKPPVDPTATVTITEKVSKMKALPGFFPLYWDDQTGKLWVEISRFDTDFLYVSSLPAGLGSNDIGLDRGQLGRERVVRFTRSGPRVLLVQLNLGFRAEQGTAMEKRAVADSFAQSVIGGFDVVAEEDGRVLVDASAFFLRDAHDVIGALKSSKQGSYSLDAQRCAFHLPMTKNFPQNTEIEVVQTFTGNEPGAWVKDIAPDPTALTVRLRHSFVQLPGSGYTPRAYDPRAGFFPTSYADYATPMGEPISKKFITRHRLEKKDPTAERSEAVKPIIYYLDPATPEPVRSALLDGARWWAAAFEAAGFINAYSVEMLPEDADPMDVRYNVIQWVHRATRGWSYGAGVTDPRTGEIIKGHVSLGSLRVRHDYLIAEGLLAPYETGQPVSPEMEKMALARLRQLSAHEVGHTIGLSHNFISSTADRSSVMDYPHPVVDLRADGTLSLGNAYGTAIGEWDKVSVDYGYRQFPPDTDEARALSQIIGAARGRGLIFLTDQDARPAGSSHPQVHLWDNGLNAVDEFQRLLGVRAAALARFGENVIKPGRPLATIEETLVPIYLLHRYQLEAAAKTIAGTTYTYALRGDGQRPIAPVAPGEQRRALNAMLGALSPATLQLPESLLDIIPPRPDGFPRHRELFANHTAENFDALAPAEAAAGITCSVLFDAGRAARLVEQHARNADQPGLAELLARTLDATWRQPAGADYPGEVQRTVNAVVLARLFALAADPAATAQVKAIAMAELAALRDWLAASAPQVAAPAQQAHYAYGARLIDQFFDDPKEFAPPRVPPPPPGPPIGCDF